MSLSLCHALIYTGGMVILICFIFMVYLKYRQQARLTFWNHFIKKWQAYELSMGRGRLLPEDMLIRWLQKQAWCYQSLHPDLFGSARLWLEKMERQLYFQDAFFYKFLIKMGTLVGFVSFLWIACLGWAEVSWSVHWQEWVGVEILSAGCVGSYFVLQKAQLLPHPYLDLDTFSEQGKDQFAAVLQGRISQRSLHQDLIQVEAGLKKLDEATSLKQIVLDFGFLFMAAACQISFWFSKVF